MKAICIGIVALLFSGVTAGADDFLPDLSKTPGSFRHELTLKQICTTKWGKDARHVTDAMKREVFQSYGLSGNSDPWCSPHPASKRRCEVDHLISRELGGADAVSNLWPQRYDPSVKWNATMKDRVDNRLAKEACAGRISLEQARDEITTDWRVPYRRYFGNPE
jgi:hypothetical protein